MYYAGILTEGIFFLNETLIFNCNYEAELIIVFNEEVEYYYIELDKFREARPDMKKPLNRWLAFIDMEKQT